MSNQLNRLGTSAGIIIVLVVFVAMSSFVTVGPGERGVLMTFGKVEPGVLEPGIHFKIPIMQTVKQIEVRIQKSEGQQTAASKDLQDVTTRVAVNWSIQPEDAEWVYQNVGDERALIMKVIEPTISNVVKAVTAKYNAENLVAKRDEIRDLIEKQITTSVANYKVQVQGVNITNFNFSKQYADAIEKKQVSQQKAQQAKYDLQRITVEAQQKIAEARGQSESQRLMQKTLTSEIIRLNAVKKWNGVLPKVVGGDGVIPFVGDITGKKTR